MSDLDSPMMIIQLIIGIIVMVSFYYFIYRFVRNKRRQSKLMGDDLRFDDIRSVYDKLKKGEIPNQKAVDKFARSLEHRTLLYEALYLFDKTDLFPSEFLNLKSFGESFLSNWLNFHDDFDALPNKIEYDQTISLNENDLVLVYKFKVYEPHLMASKGWMLGYVRYNNSTTRDLQETPDGIFTDFDSKLLSREQLEKRSQL